MIYIIANGDYEDNATNAALAHQVLEMLVVDWEGKKKKNTSSAELTAALANMIRCLKVPASPQR